MKRIPKHLTLNLRVNLLFEQADRSLSLGLPQAAILYFTLYIEQILITAACFVKREKDIDEAIQLRDTLFNYKKRYTFNKVANEVVNIIGPYISAQRLLFNYDHGDEEPNKLEELNMILSNLNKIRNTVSGHIFFTIMLDPTNRKPWKRVLSDFNYYRKVLRRLRRLIVYDLNLQVPEALSLAINYSGPILVSGVVEQMFVDAENSVLFELARYCRTASLQIREILKVFIP